MSASDRFDLAVGVTNFMVSRACFMASCVCVHYIAGNRAQFKPCQVFCECFMRGSIDNDWDFIMSGAIVGFKIVNPSCPCAYDARAKLIINDSHKSVISKKLSTELDNGFISIADAPPRCIHNVFAVPKSTGDGLRTIMYCSKPADHSVNNFVNEISKTFSYKGMDDQHAAV